MVLPWTRKFLVMQSKLLYVIFEGKKVNEIRASENRRGFRASITFWEDEVEWSLVALHEFYWMKEGKF